MSATETSITFDLTFMVNMMRQFLITSALALACVLGVATTGSAQITWEPSVNLFQGMTEQTFVDTTGELAVALNGSAETIVENLDPTVNGVTFVNTSVGTAVTGPNGQSITLNGGTDNVGSFGDGEFTGDTDIFHLLRGATFGVESVTLGGLVVGNDYRIQVFTNDARNNRTLLFQTGFGDGTGSTAPVGISDLNNSPVGSMVDPNTGNNVPITPVFPETSAGDSIIGTFTADATSLTFVVFGSNTDPANFTVSTEETINGRAQINGIQLRDVTEMVPEVLKGDVNLDGGVTFLDINPFIVVLSSNGFQAEADCDCDGDVDFLDIQPFIDILAGL